MSEKFNEVKNFYVLEVWSEKKVRNAVVKGWITAEEFKLITSKDY